MQENNALRKGRVPQSAEDALAENERLQAALNRAITAEKELRDGYAAVQRFLDEGNFGGNQDLREELRKVLDYRYICILMYIDGV